MKANKNRRVLAAVVVGALLICLVTLVTSAVPETDVTISTSHVASPASEPTAETFVDSTDPANPPYGALLDGPTFLL